MFAVSSALLFILLFWFILAQYAPPQPPPQYPKSEYKWIADDDFFDCVVGIDLAGKPVGMGIFIYYTIILTSAAPLNSKGWNTWTGNLPDHEIEVYAVSGAWYESQRLYVDLVIGNQLDRNGRWVKIGTDGRHTTIFDFFIITLKTNGASYYSETWHLKPPRQPWFVGYLFVDKTKGDNHKLYDPHGWKWAAFAFLDLDHINESVQLAAKYYPLERPLEDCDEWIPRPWGHFICLRNENNYIGIQNGAVLFNKNELLGLGAFELNKGNESILVFTDLLFYRRSLNIRYTPTTTSTTTTTGASSTRKKKKENKWGK